MKKKSPYAIIYNCVGLFRDTKKSDIWENLKARVRKSILKYCTLYCIQEYNERQKPLKKGFLNRY